MRKFVFKLLGVVAIASLVALSASADSVSLSGSGTIGITSSGSGNVTVCLGGGSPCTNTLSLTGSGTGAFTGTTSFMLSAGAPISLTQVGSTCVFANTSLSGVTFAGGDVSGMLSSLTVSQASSQVSSGLASISGSGTITSVGGVSANVPFDFSGTINVGAGVNICALPGGGVSGSIAPTPESGTLPLAAIGLLLFGGAVRRWFAS